MWDADAWIYGVQGLFAVGIELALLAGAIVLWQRGLVTVGDFVLIQVYILGLMDRIWSIGNNMRQLYDAFADATEMLDILELPHGVLDAPDATPLQVSEGAISFDHVHFEYYDSQEVLNDFDLAIRPHEKVALVGSSGAGKTTIAKLLLRLYDVSGGAITIDGQDIARVTQESLRRAIAFVPQEPMLFHRSLMDNIRYGRQEATDEEVIEAAKQAHCYEFINRYHEGFETLVGERGIKLSGGERQSVAIARAILKNAPDPRARRSDVKFGFRIRTAYPRHAPATDEREDRHRYCAPALHRDEYGPPRRDRKGRSRSLGHARRTSRAREQSLQKALGDPGGRFHSGGLVCREQDLHLRPSVYESYALTT